MELKRLLFPHQRSWSCIVTWQAFRFGGTLTLTVLITSGVLMVTPPAAIATPISQPTHMMHRPIPAAGLLLSQGSQFPPTLANRLQQDLSQHTRIPPNQLRMVETTARTWPNGCLGLARPDEMCSQAMVEGWRVVFTNGQRQWVYRTDRQGRTFRLEP